MRRGRSWFFVLLVLLVCLALWAGWRSGLFSRPVNSPYPAGAMATSTLFTAFTQRSPRTLDPAVSYSSDESTYTYAIYQPLYQYHYLKRPYTLVPNAAAAVIEPTLLDAQGNVLPEDAPGENVAESVYDIPIKPGIRYAPHPAFAQDGAGNYRYHALTPETLGDIRTIGAFEHTGTRELTAEDYVYQIRRIANPRVVSPIYAQMSEHIVGMREYGDRLRALDAELRAAGRANAWLDLREHGFDGVQALDAHTLRIRVVGKYPQFSYWLAMSFFAPMPWEAERFYQQPGMAERNLTLKDWPVGTGPYYMANNELNWRIELKRNPYFASLTYPCEGEPQDAAEGRLADCGKPLPFIDRAVFSIEKEAVPLQGKFMQGYYDVPQIERGEYGVAFRVAAEDSPDKAALYAERGLQLPTTVETSIWYMGFNWLDPVVGKGDTPEQEERNRKLRQAISIAVDWEQYVAIFEANQAQVGYGPVPPGVLGHQSGPEGANPYVYDVADGQVQRKSLDEARRLLAEAGYPDGRDAKTGAPLVLHYDAMGGASGARPQYDWMQRQFAKLGIQLEVRSTDYNRFQEKMINGVAQIFMWGWLADYPDAENFLFLLYGPHAKAGQDGENAANYRNPEFDALFDRMKYLDDGPQKEEIIHRMTAIVQRDAPWMFGYYPASGGAYHQWVGNAKPSQMVRNALSYLSIDAELRAAKVQEWNRPVWWPLALLVLLLALLVVPAARLLRRRERATALEALP
ncbi:peptide ABC transporter substrate-binding protein [Verticiella sediminum]|uniref:Peptide ABC transporter substrate-binding protein n=1 Tax=Verticiella sediminum TaxID=1247510 RepID=A0A556AW32_9BURK|nr:ABC transporter substrate-binding protein [Verticiella sediminum]TSH97137.1 peptide ABC transporter substrate-binding protein [Verticiella sediminum]